MLATARQIARTFGWKVAVCDPNFDPQKVAQRGLSAGDIVRAIREQNVQAAAGVVGASPGLPGVDVSA